MTERTNTTLVDRANLIYQSRPGSLAANVYDRDVVLTPEARDYASITDLIKADIKPGRFATCQIAGLLRLGARPDGEVTAELQAA
jgi:hypothetical protein